MKVKDITSKIGAASDKIPVTIRRGFETIGTSKSLSDLGNGNASGAEKILESTRRKAGRYSMRARSQPGKYFNDKKERCHISGSVQNKVN